jgi:AcrR family transcriptional regulator
MKNSPSPFLSPRKQPQQARSTQLVADILEAAIRVLKTEGGHRFTMARVAERAGVSVGSVYQYFPNKQAILFRLQTDEWKMTNRLLEEILSDATLPPLERLRKSVCAFFQSEYAEVKLRTALRDAAPLYRETPEAGAHRGRGTRQMQRLVKEACPEIPPSDLKFAADLVAASTAAIGKKISEQARSLAEVDAFAGAVGEMLSAYLQLYFNRYRK